MIVIFPA